MYERLLERLPEEEQKAVELVRVIIDCFNTKATRKAGIGLFSGAGRYEMLTKKLPDAVEKGVDREGRYRMDLFYSRLLQTMAWPNPPLAAEKLIFERMLSIPKEQTERTLSYLLRNAPSVVGFASAGHVELREQTEAELRRRAKDAEGPAPEEEWRAILAAAETEGEETAWNPELTEWP